MGSFESIKKNINAQRGDCDMAQTKRRVRTKDASPTDEDAREGSWSLRERVRMDTAFVSQVTAKHAPPEATPPSKTESQRFPRRRLRRLSAIQLKQYSKQLSNSYKISVSFF
jgi:hypothetical protein